MGTPPVLGPQHPRIAELRRLTGRRSSRSAEILLEGPRTIGEALDAGLSLLTVVVPEGSSDVTDVVAVRERLDAGVEQLVVRDKVFARLAPSVTPQPMLAIAQRPVTAIPDRVGDDGVVLVLVDVGDPGNVGTLVRVADAVGASCVVVAGGADPWGPKAVRASAGSVLRVPVVTGVEADAALTALRTAGMRIVGTDVRRGEAHDGGILRRPVAVVLGSEPHGLDPGLAPLVDGWAHIDMPGHAESLNVAMAGTLLAYEAAKGR